MPKQSWHAAVGSDLGFLFYVLGLFCSSTWRWITPFLSFLLLHLALDHFFIPYSFLSSPSWRWILSSFLLPWLALDPFFIPACNSCFSTENYIDWLIG